MENLFEFHNDIDEEEQREEEEVEEEEEDEIEDGEEEQEDSSDSEIDDSSYSVLTIEDFYNNIEINDSENFNAKFTLKNEYEFEDCASILKFTQNSYCVKEDFAYTRRIEQITLINGYNIHVRKATTISRRCYETNFEPYNISFKRHIKHFSITTPNSIRDNNNNNLLLTCKCDLHFHTRHCNNYYLRKIIPIHKCAECVSKFNSLYYEFVNNKCVYYLNIENHFELDLS